MRRRKRWQPIAGIMSLFALALLAGLVWRALRTAPAPPLAEPRRAQQREPQIPSGDAGEEFSDVERQGLDEILKQHGAGKPR